jgi:hypothetical protein
MMLKTRRLTSKLIDCSRKTGMVGVELVDMISGELRRKGTDEFFRLSKPFLDSFYQMDPQTHALLMDYLWVPRVVSSDGFMMNSDEVLRMISEVIQRLREFERLLDV